MTKLDIFKDKAQTWVEQELKTARKNALDKGEFEFVDIYESVLDQRFPNWQNRNYNNHSGGKPHIAKIKSEEVRFENAITAFVWLVNRLFKMHPEIKDSSFYREYITKGVHGAIYVAKDPRDLFKNYKTATMNFVQLDNGLFLKKNLSIKQMLDLLIKLCVVTKLNFETDWDFYEVGNKQPSLDEILSLSD